MEVSCNEGFAFWHQFLCLLMEGDLRKIFDRIIRLKIGLSETYRFDKLYYFLKFFAPSWPNAHKPRPWPRSVQSLPKLPHGVNMMPYGHIEISAKLDNAWQIMAIMAQNGHVLTKFAQTLLLASSSVLMSKSQILAQFIMSWPAKAMWPHLAQP